MTVASALPAATLARVGRHALASAGPDEDLADARGSSVIFRTLSRNRGPDLHEHIVTPTHDNTHDTVTDADTLVDAVTLVLGDAEAVTAYAS